MMSVVIPAHNEEAVIGRLLDGLTRDATADELEIHVVCNGCTDRTAELARTYGPVVHVVEAPVRSKSKALNLGDEIATSFPRFFVDADVEVDAEALRSVARVLAGPTTLVAAPTITFELAGLSLPARLYHRFWETMPYFDDTLVGSGIYAFNEDGRERFDAFPDIIADDLFVLHQFAPHERKAVADARFVKHPPRTLRSVIRTRTRAAAGQRELASMPANPTVGRRDRRATVDSRWRRVLAAPGLWVAAPVYTAVYMIVWVRAWWKVRCGDMQRWERDDTARRPS